jgi:hypothetical protein
MDTGRDFLKAQLNNCIAQHQTLVENLRDHAEQADDPRYRQLCQQYLPQVERHQGMIEEYGRTLGAEGGGGLKGAFGSVIGKARDAVDAMRETDFLRVVGDIVMIRQSQDTFGTFARAGERLGEQRLAEIGRMGEQEHDQMQRQFNQYCAELFVDHVQGTVPQADGTRQTKTRTTGSSTY